MWLIQYSNSKSWLTSSQILCCTLFFGTILRDKNCIIYGQSCKQKPFWVFKKCQRNKVQFVNLKNNTKLKNWKFYLGKNEDYLSSRPLQGDRTQRQELSSPYHLPTHLIVIPSPPSVHLIHLIIYLFICMASPMAYGCSWPEVELELQLQAYTTAMATPDPSHICNLRHKLKAMLYP